MAAISTMIAVAGLAVAGGSAYASYQQNKSNAQAQQQYQNQALAEQQKQDQLRQQAMDLDAMRRQRSTLRASLQARAAARSIATGQGAQFGSVLPGAFGGIEGSANTNMVGVRQSQELGTEMFASNSRLSGIYRDAAAANSEAQTNMAFYNGLSSMGGAMVNNAQTISKIGPWLSSKFATA